MTIRRCLKLLLAGAVVLAAMGWGGWLVIRAQLAELGIEQVEASGLALGWNQLSFDTLNLTWAADNREVRIETRYPRITMDWRDWQLDRLVAGSTRIQPVADRLGEPDKARAGGPAFELTLPQDLPFWLPRHLAVNALEASFPCQQAMCRLRGQFTLDRTAESADLRLDASLHRADDTLEIRGDVRLGSGASTETTTRGELKIIGLDGWLPAGGSAALARLAPDAATLGFSHSAASVGPGEWPMTLSLDTEGGAGLAFDGQVVLHTGTPWRLVIDRGRLTGELARWRQDGWLLEGLTADLPVTGKLAAAEARVTVGDGALVRVRHLDPLSVETLMWADTVALSPAGAELAFRNGQFSLQGPFELSANEVRHPSLITQAWHLRGDLHWRQRLETSAILSSAAGTRVPFNVTLDPVAGLSGSLDMTLSPDNQSSHLAETLAWWPQTLVLEEGQVEGRVSFQRPPGGEISGEARLGFDQASGLYQNMAWRRLTGEVEANWDPGALTLRSDRLTLEQINPGVPIGPVRIEAAEYRAEARAPAAGDLALESARAGFAGGTLHVPGDTWSLAEGPWRVPVTVEGLELSELMNLYPTEGLAGEGTLQGNLPVVIGAAGVSIDGGKIAALPPGGRLQLPADKLQTMARSNAAMELVARAMEDFHYRLLETEIDYSEDGKLLLDLQLRGSSPGVDSERPVVLNINLEEDIPALLTSLQLSGRVNEAVTERVRERLQQDEVDAR